MTSLEEILSEAEEEFLGMIENGEVNDLNYEEVIGEIADSSVPVYTADLLEAALNTLWLAAASPELLAFDGESTAVNAIAGNIYEAVEEHLRKVWDDYEEEEEEEEDEKSND